MTLLDATTTLIDFARTNGSEEDACLARAIKRMEQRLFVLQVRHAKRQKQIRTKAFWDAMCNFNGGACQLTRQACIPCPTCQLKIFSGDFMKNAEWTGTGKVLTLACPKCGCLMERKKS